MALLFFWGFIIPLPLIVLINSLTDIRSIAAPLQELACPSTGDEVVVNPVRAVCLNQSGRLIFDCFAAGRRTSQFLQRVRASLPSRSVLAIPHDADNITAIIPGGGHER
jgi:hypothetical protein